MKPTSVAALGAIVLPTFLAAFTGEYHVVGPDPVTVTITAHDYSFEAPDSVLSGAVTLKLVNRGKEFHHIWLVRIDHGKTPADFIQALSQGHGALPVWAREVGGPNAPAPGGEANATVELDPGTYLITCAIPSADGKPHIMKGMIRTMVVTKAAQRAPMPEADVTMILRDYSFTTLQALTAGRRVIEVRNYGRQSHEIELVRLAPGKSAHDVLQWIEKPEGAAPGLPLGGVSPLASGGRSQFTVDLEVGRYALICFLPDRGDGKPHFMHGMMQEIEVGLELTRK
jgi:uncharacterized cupredoxin-like copper-binding protein